MLQLLPTKLIIVRLQKRYFEKRILTKTLNWIRSSQLSSMKYKNNSFGIFSKDSSEKGIVKKLFNNLYVRTMKSQLFYFLWKLMKIKVLCLFLFKQISSNSSISTQRAGDQNKLRCLDSFEKISTLLKTSWWSDFWRERKEGEKFSEMKL